MEAFADLLADGVAELRVRAVGSHLDGDVLVVPSNDHGVRARGGGVLREAEPIESAHVEDALAHQAVDGLANALVPVRRAHHGVVGAVPLEPRADLGRAPVLLHVGSGRVAVVRRNRTRSRVRPRGSAGAAGASAVPKSITRAAEDDP